MLAPARLHVQKSTPVAGILCKDYTLCKKLLVQNPMNPTLEAYHHAVHYIQCTCRKKGDTGREEEDPGRKECT